MAWLVEVYAASVECANTESIGSDDSFAIVGSVLVDGRSHGFITPAMAVGPGETQTMGGYPTGPGELYRGWSDTPRLGFTVRGYDMDDNEKWVRDRETVKKVVDAIEKITDDIPVVGDIVSVAAKIPAVVDVFVDADSDDLVLGHTGSIDLTAGPPELTVTEWKTIRTRRDDDTGYSSSDYTLNLRIVHRQTAGSFGDRTIPRLHPHQGSDLDDWIGAWQGPHVDCVISRATSGLGVSDVLTVQITERVDGRATHIHERAVRINKPFLADATTGPTDIPTSRQPEGRDGDTLIGTGAVEGVAREGAAGPSVTRAASARNGTSVMAARAPSRSLTCSAAASGGGGPPEPTTSRSIRTWSSNSTCSDSAERWSAPGCATSDRHPSQLAPVPRSWTRCWRPASSSYILVKK